MDSTKPTSSGMPEQPEPVAREPEGPSVLRWRDWPLAEHRRWSWVVPAGIVATGAGVGFTATNGWLGVAAAVALTVTLWQFLMPAQYEVNPVGFSRQVLGYRRLVPWQAVRAYQPRAAGIVLYHRDDPAPIDALRSEFLPYAADEDETLCAVRQHLPHAVELPG
jgi:hypothetical protein